MTRIFSLEFVSFVLSLFLFCSGHPHSGLTKNMRDVVVINHGASHAPNEPEIPANLLKSGEVAVDLNANPELVPAAREITAMVNRLILPSDPYQTVYVALVDDMEVNASFHRRDDGSAILRINLGMLRFLENDDELAFVIGHELEHGVSAMGPEAKRVLDAGYEFRSYALARVEENEVDVKSIFRRMIDQGFNPHAAPRFLRHMRDAFGSGASMSHTSSASRQDTVALAIQYLQRVEGRQFPPDEISSFARALTGPLHEFYYNRPDFLPIQRRRWQAHLERLPNPATKLYEEVRDNKVSGQLADNYFAKQYRARYASSQTYLGGLLSTEEDRALQLEILTHLDSQFEQARAAIVGENFQFQTADQLEQLLSLNRRHYLPFEADESLSEVMQHMFKQERQRTWLQHYESDRGLSPEERAAQIREEKLRMAEINEKTAALHLAYPAWSAVKRRVKLYREALSSRNIERQNELSREHLEEHAQIGHFLRRNRLYEERLLQSSVDFIVSSIDHPKNWRDSLDLFDALPGAVKNKNIFTLIDRILERAEHFTKKRSRGKSSEKQLEQILSFDISNTFSTALTVDRNRTLEAIRRLFRVALQAPTSTDSGVYGKTGYYKGVHISDGEIALSADVATEVFLDKDLAVQVVEDVFRNSEVFLPLKSQRSPMAAMEFFLQTLNQLKDHGLLEIYGSRTGETGQQIYERQLSRAIDQQIEFLHSRVLEAGVTLSPEITRNFYFATERRYARFLPKHLTPTPLAIRNSLKEMSIILRAPGVRERLTQKMYLLSIANLMEVMDFPHEEEKYAFVLKVLPILMHSVNADTEDFNFRVDLTNWMLARPAHSKKELQFLASISAPIGSNEVLLEKTARVFGFFLDRTLSAQAETQVRNRWHGAGLALWKQLVSAHSNWEINSSQLAKAFIARLPRLAQTRAAAWLGYIDATRTLAKNPKDMRRFIPSQELSHDLSSKSFQRTVALDDYTSLLMHYLDVSKSSTANDDLIENWWRMTEQRPDLRRMLGPERIQSIHYDSRRQTIGLWQLNDHFQLRQHYETARTSTRSAMPDGSEVRPIIQEVSTFIKTQVPVVGGVREALINEAERLLVTNKRETDALAKLRVNDENWVSNHRVVAIDLGHKYSREMEHEINRLNTLEYLIGITEKVPPFIMRSPNRVEYESDLNSTRRAFMDSDLNSRTYSLMALVDPKIGVLSSEYTTGQLINHLLGAYSGQPVVRALFVSYLESLPESERSVVVSRLCSTFTSSAVGESGSKRLSLATVLETMGPLGIKAGQFLRSSGLLSPELREELNHMFSRANPPTRPQIFERVQQLLGPHFSNFSYLGELVGSGSVNYVVRATLKDPATGENRDVVVRILRQSVEGQVANEDRVWQRTVESLKQSGDAEELRLSHLVEESRSNAMRSLVAGGQELDLSLESEYYSEVARSYEHSPPTESGFRVEVARPLTEFVGLIPEQNRMALNLYDYVASTNLEDITDTRLRAELAERITSSELQAMFVHGAFDPDGHRGNWLIDMPGKRLVRIDYSQTTRLDSARRIALRDVVGLLIKPSLGHSDLMRLQNHFASLFVLNVQPSTAELTRHLREISNDSGFPSYRAPHERLFFIRDQLESRLMSSKTQLVKSGHATHATHEARIRLTPEAQSVFASLARVSGMREYMSPLRFAASLARSLNLSPELHFARVFSHEIMNEIASISRGLRLRLSVNNEGVKGVLQSGSACVVNALKKLNK